MVKYFMEGSCVVENPIVVPKGEFSAPGDYKIIRVGKESENFYLVKQLYSGNCAEYTMINTILMAKGLEGAGLKFNDKVENYLKNNPSFNLDIVEKDLVIPMLCDSLDKHKEMKPGEEHTENLSLKLNNPYESLTALNSILLFRDALSPRDTKIKSTDKIDGTNINDAFTEDFCAFFIGDNNHATSILKLKDDYYHIDPYFNEEVARVINIDKAKEIIKKASSSPDSIVIKNKLYQSFANLKYFTPPFP